MNADAWLTGRRGQTLAVAIGVLALALLWFGVIAPVRSWFADRTLLLERRQGLLHHMQEVTATLPTLRAASAAKPGRGEGSGTIMLPGATDAVAAADLQERIQQMASSVGASLTAVETLRPRRRENGTR